VTPVARRIVAARGLRGFVDGLVSVVLTLHLLGLGWSPSQVGAIVTGTLVGSAVLTIVAGLAADRIGVRPILLAGTAVMVATGVGFASLTAFWPLLAIAVAGTLNPSAGDVTLFLPTEQAVIAAATPAPARPGVFAWYNLAGALAGALGALAAGAGGPVAFVVYALTGVLLAGLYAGTVYPPMPRRAQAAAPLVRSRAIVLRLTALFSLDALGGGFVVQSILVLWLTLRFDLSVETISRLLFATGILGALSQLVSARLATRIGLVRTMVYTHLPANVLLIVAGLVPNAGAAVGCLLARALLSQMDVPVRQAYVMSVVPPEERAAAATVTAVPRSLASALPPLIVGLMLDRSVVGWPLVIGGVLKAIYDVLLLVQLRGIPVEDAAA
jgi:MFS family permease